MMKFVSLEYLWILWIIPCLILLLIYTERKRKQKTGKLISRDLWPHILPDLLRTRRTLKAVLLVVGLIFLCLTLLRPQWGFDLQEVKRKGVDLFVLVDVSSSMLAQDIKPSRMERAQRELIDLLSYLQGDRIGLIPFAGVAYVACPLTTDYGAFQLFIDQLETDLIPIQGTNVMEAMQKALLSFDPGDSRSKAIILISDGEATQGEWSEIVKKTKEAEVSVFVIGMGTEKGAPIPIPESGGFKKGTDGQLIISKLDESSLKQLALVTGGTYVRSVTGDLDLEEIYLKGIKKVTEEKELKSGMRRVALERFQVPLFIALIFLLLEMILGDARNKRTDS